MISSHGALTIQDWLTFDIYIGIPLMLIECPNLRAQIAKRRPACDVPLSCNNEPTQIFPC